MNILPKKSWHVRTKKNIERVKRDEAQAERLAKIEQDRVLIVEQEVRARELRARAGIPEPKPKHINLFEGFEPSGQSTNKDHEEEQRQEERRWQERVGILNRLGRSEDANRPWYLSGGSKLDAVATDETNRGSRRQRNSALITSLYDPMTAIKSAEQIVRAKRIERKRERDKSRVLDTQKQARQSVSLSLTAPPTVAATRPSILHHVESDSSPEILKVVKSHPKDQKEIQKKDKKHFHKHSKHKKQREHKR